MATAFACSLWSIFSAASVQIIEVDRSLNSKKGVTALERATRRYSYPDRGSEHGDWLTEVFGDLPAPLS